MFMFVGARVWDAVNDSIMGKICDKFKVSKWGRYRLWFLYGSIPLALSAILMFVKWPGFGSEASSFGVYICNNYIYCFWYELYGDSNSLWLACISCYFG